MNSLVVAQQYGNISDTLVPTSSVILINGKTGWNSSIVLNWYSSVKLFYVSIKSSYAYMNAKVHSEAVGILDTKFKPWIKARKYP